MHVGYQSTRIFIAHPTSTHNTYIESDKNHVFIKKPQKNIVLLTFDPEGY
jgi:hypothetical protein